MYSTLADCESGATPATYGQIVATQNESGEMFVKVPPPGSFKLEPSQVTVAHDPGESIGWGHGSNETYTSMAPRIVLLAPTKIVKDGCYRLALKRELGDGTPYGGQNVSASLAATVGRNVLYTDAACQTAGSASQAVTLSGGMDRGEFFVRSPTNSAFSLTATLAGYTTVTQQISVYNESLNPARIVVEAVSSPMAAGMCNEFRAYHVNGAGTPVPWPNPTPAVTAVRFNRAGASAYWFPGCTTPGSLNVNPGQVYVPLWVKTSAIGDYEISVDTGGVVTNNIPGLPKYTVGFAAPSATGDFYEPWILVNAPDFKSKIVGSHEFPLTISMRFPKFTSVKCFVGASTPCPTTVGSTPGIWTRTGDSSAGIDYELIWGLNNFNESFRIEYTRYGNMKSYYISKSTLWPGVTFSQCSATLYGASLTAANIAGAISSLSGSNTLCLGGGGTGPASLTLTSPIALPQNMVWKIIGKLGTDLKTPNVTLSSATDSIWKADPGYMGDGMLGNLKMQITDASGANGPRAAIKINTASSAQFMSVSNTYSVDSLDDSTRAIWIEGSAGQFFSESDSFKIKSLGASSMGIGIDAANSGNVYVGRSAFIMEASSTGMNAPVAMAQRANTLGQFLNVEQSDIRGNGTAFTSDSSTGYSASLAVRDSYIALANGETNSTKPRYLYNSGGNREVSFERNRIDLNIPFSSPIYFRQTNMTSPFATDQYFRHNHVVQRQNVSLIYAHTVSGGNDRDLNLNLLGNHFVRSYVNNTSGAGGGSTATVVANAVGANRLYVKRPVDGDPIDGNNKYCAIDVGTLWADFVSGTALRADTDSLTWASPNSITSAPYLVCP